MTNPFFCKHSERPEVCWPCAVERIREQWPEVQSTAEAFREYARQAGVDAESVVDAVLERLNPNSARMP